MSMINREIRRSEAIKSMAESQKAFDESINSLVKWLHEATAAGFISKAKAAEYFKEESERRKNQAKELLAKFEDTV